MKLQKLVYAGHSAVFLHGDNFVMAVDPWLEGNPRCPKELANPKRLDLIVLTHGHADHAGDAVRLANHCGSHIAATYELAMIMLQEGVPSHKVLPMNKGGSAEFGGVQLTLTHAFHSSSYDSNRGTLYAGEACGVVIRDGTASIYHAGDTALFSDMRLIGEQLKPTLALLPIGDRFTMGPRDAAAALKLVGAKTAVPVHYQTFDALSGTADAFRAECGRVPELRDCKIMPLEPGQEMPLA